MIEVTIDGKKLTVPEGTTIIEAADDAGIYIPRFCYHKKLSIAANCRMCLVEVVNGRGPVPACATPVMKDMQVHTQSKAALESQRAVMEFLLINHPLDCPICDQGGECELQDLAMGYGSPDSHYDEAKRAVASEDIGPLVETEMTRCIHCTRCVRFGEEVAGLRELGVTFRGENSEIGTYVQHFLTSELSGNVIDVCPVGALTAKPSRYQERAWQLQEHATIAPHDCVGSNIFVHSRGQEYVPQREVIRAVPRENEAVNEVWISDRDRFSYEGVHHEDRLLTPRIKQNGQWVACEWKQALMHIADVLQTVLQAHGPEQLGMLLSPNSTLEEAFLLQKLCRLLGSPHIDYRVRDLDFSDQDTAPECDNLGVTIDALETQSAILLVGANLRFEQPMLNHRIVKAVDAGAKVMLINAVDYPANYTVANQIIDHDLVWQLSGVAKALADDCGASYPELSSVSVSETAKAMAQTLKQSERSSIIFGLFAMQHPQASQLRMLARLIGELSGSQIGGVSDGANAQGAALAGALPHRGPANTAVSALGDTAQAMLTTAPKKAYFLLGLEPESDTAYPAAALTALKQAELVVCFSSYATPLMADYADVILPIAPFTENAGTFVNITETWQSFAAATVPKGEAKPAWKVIRVLANFLQLDGFEYKTAHQVRDEVKRLMADKPAWSPPAITLCKLAPVSESGLRRLAPMPLYRCDALVRRAASLQACSHDPVSTGLRVHSRTAAAHQLAEGVSTVASQGGQTITLPLTIDDRIAPGLVMLPAALPETAGFGEAMAEIQLRQEK